MRVNIEAHSKSGNKSKGDDCDGTEGAPSADRSTPDQEGSNVSIKPVKEKIGEGRDNLRRREQWFQRRSGKGK
jgi:hypothetical protein